MEFFKYEDVVKNIDNCNFESDNFIKQFICWDGKLIGEDNGEWGGSLKFINSKGKKINLLNDNIISIIDFNNRIIAITGRDIIYQLNRVGKRISVNKIIILPRNNFKIKKLNNNEIMIATLGGTVILSNELKLKMANCK